MQRWIVSMPLLVQMNRYECFHMQYNNNGYKYIYINDSEKSNQIYFNRSTCLRHKNNIHGEAETKQTTREEKRRKNTKQRW